MNIPGDLKYTKDHEWVKISGDSAIVGITDFAQAELGEVVFVDLPAPGKEIKRSDSICVVESTKAASDVYTPVGGKVKEVNSKLTDSPNLVNTSPYVEGWMVKLEKVNQKDLEGLMSAEEYKKHVGEKA